MKDLHAVKLNLGAAGHAPGRRFIGFCEGPYERTAQIAVPEDWSVYAFVDYDDPAAAASFDERRRSIYCISISPDNDNIIAYKWRVGERHDPIRINAKDLSMQGDKLIELAEEISKRFNRSSSTSRARHRRA